MLWAEQPSRQAQAIGGRILWQRGKERGNRGRYFFRLIAVIASRQHECVARFGHLGHYLNAHHLLLELGGARFEGIEFAIDSAYVGGSVVAQEIIQQSPILLLGTL